MGEENDRYCKNWDALRQVNDLLMTIYKLDILSQDEWIHSCVRAKLNIITNDKYKCRVVIENMTGNQ